MEYSGLDYDETYLGNFAVAVAGAMNYWSNDADRSPEEIAKRVYAISKALLAEHQKAAAELQVSPSQLGQGLGM